jgi:rhamnogalacturonan endolyase
MKLTRLTTALLLLAMACLGHASVLVPRMMEDLGRGVVAIQQHTNPVFVSWRLLGTDPDDLGFHLYCASGDTAPVRLNSELLRGPTLWGVLHR